MTTDRAKQVLLAYRPGSVDADDFEIARALELAARDSELREWLAGQNAFQNHARDELRRIPVPAALKSKILAGRPSTGSFWRRREFLALAASVAILVSGGAYWLSKSADRETFANFRARMVGFALRTYEMDILTPDRDKVRAYLAEHGAPSAYSLPPALSRMPVKGGARLSWQNHPVGMMCFALPQNETLYLFVINGAVLPGGKPSEKVARIIAEDHLSTAAWTAGQQIYLLAARIDAKTLAKLADQRGG